MATCCLAGQHKVNKPLQRRPSSSFVHSQPTSAARLGRTLAGRTTTTGFNLPLGRRAKHKRVKYGRSAGQLRALATTTTTSGTCIAAAPSKRSFFFFSCSDVAVSRALGLLCPQSSSSVPLLPAAQTQALGQEAALYPFLENKAAPWLEAATKQTTTSSLPADTFGTSRAG